MHGEIKPLFKRLQIQLFVLRMIEFVSHITRIHVVFVTYVREFVSEIRVTTKKCVVQLACVRGFG